MFEIFIEIIWSICGDSRNKFDAANRHQQHRSSDAAAAAAIWSGAVRILSSAAARHRSAYDDDPERVAVCIRRQSSVHRLPLLQPIDRYDGSIRCRCMHLGDLRMSNVMPVSSAVQRSPRHKAQKAVDTEGATFGYFMTPLLMLQWSLRSLGLGLLYLGEVNPHA